MGLLDVFVIMMELFLEAEFPSCRIIKRDAISCCSLDASFSPLSRNGHSQLCEAPLVASPSFDAGCDKHAHSGAHALHSVLAVISLGILSVFQIELCLLLWCEKLKFFYNVWYITDLVVVTLSLALEIMGHIFKKHETKETLEMLGFLLFVRCWRFLRIGHGLGASIHEITHNQLEGIQSTCDELSQQMQHLAHQNSVLY